MAKIVSIIPARGGSKGIPRKNLVDLAGKPLIYYTIKASLESNVDETWVSSEDSEILAVSQQFGARVLKRPAQLATDTASSESVLLHFAEHIDFDILVFLQATSPLTVPEDINRSIEMLRDYDSVITVSRLTQFVWTNGEPNYNIYDRRRRQDADTTYVETGALFAATRKMLIETKTRISGRIGFCRVPRIRSFDIDSYEDLELLRMLMQ